MDKGVHLPATGKIYPENESEAVEGIIFDPDTDVLYVVFEGRLPEKFLRSSFSLHPDIHFSELMTEVGEMYFGQGEMFHQIEIYGIDRS